MTVKNIKEEARRKLALNIHQAIAVYAVEFTVFITLLALIVMSCVTIGNINIIASIVMICYGVALFIISFVGIGIISFAMTDFYLVSYKCKPYNIRRLGETIARSNVTKIFLLSLQRRLIGLLLTLCLIVPGVIYFIRTSMASYLLIANPKMKPKTALSASNKIMSGKTGPYFVLSMSMIGWYILGIFTLGLGFIFIFPYINLVKVEYYKRAIQGDKGTYALPPLDGVVRQQEPPRAQPATVSVAAQPEGAAPIDTLAEEDVLEMDSAMRDFDENNGIVQDVRDVPEVPLAAPAKKKEKTEQTPVTDSHEHRIDGTGLVETERTLSTQEVMAGEQAQQRAIDNMYSNSGPQAPARDYFSSSRSSDGFVDDFGTSEPEPAPVVEPVIEPVVEPVVEAESAEPIMSDSELDKFLEDFDSQTESEQQQAPIPPQPQRRTPPIRNGQSAAERRAEAQQRIERDRQALHERMRERRASPQTTERLEKMRREREQRLQNNNNTDRK